MSKKRISENQRLITFAMTASEGELNFALDTLTGIRNSRFPKVVVAKTVKRRGPNKPKDDIGPKPSASNGAADAEAGSSPSE